MNLTKTFHEIVDFENKEFTYIKQIKQNDSITYIVKIANNIDLVGCTVNLNIVKPDNTLIVRTEVAENIDNVKKEVKFIIPPEATQIAGILQMEVQIIKAGNIITSFERELEIIPSILSNTNIPSTAIVTIIDTLRTTIVEANNINTKLETNITNGNVAKIRQDVDKNIADIATANTNINTVIDLATYLNTLVYNAMQPYTNLKERLDNIENKDVGLIGYFADVVPTGWLECVGQEVLKTTYPILFARIGIKYGESTDKTKFKLPDLRGQFLRCANTTATGIDTNRTVGSTQTDAIKLHNHGFGTGQLAYVGSGYTSTGKILVSSSAIGGGSPSGIDVSSFGTTETRPTNIALLACIKY